MLEKVTCAIKAPRPYDWAGVMLAVGIAENEAQRQKIQNPTWSILTPDPQWLHAQYEPHDKTKAARRREIAILGEGFCEKE